MILRKLELKHFGIFGERAFEFRRGMNLVVGPNEAGKTTLMESIPAVLFGVRNKDRFRPWGRQGSCEAALVLENNSGTLHVERDILTDQVLLSERDDLYQELYKFEGKASPQGRSSERTEYLQQLTRLFGVAEEDIFRASLFFGQGNLEISGQGALAAKMKTLLSGFVEVDYDRVLSSLSDDYFNITRQNPWGKDKTRDRELEEVHKRISILEKKWYEAQGSLKELENLRIRIGELSESIESDREEYTKGEKYLAWVRKQWHLEEKEESLRRDFDRVSSQTEKVSELEDQRRKLEEELKKTGLPQEMPDDLPLLLKEAEGVRKDLVKLQAEANELREEFLAHSNPPWYLSALLSAFLVAGGGISAWMFPEWLNFYLLGAGVTTAVVWLFYAWRVLQQRSERNRINGQSQVLDSRREEVQQRLASIDGRFEGIGMSPSAVDIVKMQKNLDRHRQLNEKLKEVVSALKVLEASDDLKKEKDDLTRNLAVLDERMEQDRPLRGEEILPPEELPAAEEKLEKLAESLKQREKELLELTRHEAALEGELVSLEQIEEEGDRLREREIFLARRKDSLCIAYDLLSEAVEEFRQTYLDGFAEEIGAHLKAATCGKYDEVRLNDDFSLFLKGKGGVWHPLECFSRGTVDAVFFAVRLALTRHLSHGHRLPMLLDDPLVNFDSSRLRDTLCGVEQISTEHQIIYFTHDESLLKRAAQKRWNVVLLEGLKNVSPSEIQERREDVGQLSFL